MRTKREEDMSKSMREAVHFITIEKGVKIPEGFKSMLVNQTGVALVLQKGAGEERAQHKYVRREMGTGGRWIYFYKDPTGKTYRSAHHPISKDRALVSATGGERGANVDMRPLQPFSHPDEYKRWTNKKAAAGTVEHAHEIDTAPAKSKNSQADQIARFKHLASRTKQIMAMYGNVGHERFQKLAVKVGDMLEEMKKIKAGMKDGK